MGSIRKKLKLGLFSKFDACIIYDGRSVTAYTAEGKPREALSTTA